MAPLFEQALDLIFSRWTLLALAVEQSWGGRDSRAKAKQLQAEIVELLSQGARRRRPPSYENPDDVMELANFIFQRLDELFNTEADDKSDEEIALMCMRLFNTCAAGDPSFAQQIVQACQVAPPADLSQSRGQMCMEYASPEDELLDQMQGMDLDMEGSEEESDEDDAVEQSGQGAPPAAPPSIFSSSCFMAAPQAQPAPQVAAVPRPPPPEPIVDEDGFVSVTKGRRKPR